MGINQNVEILVQQGRINKNVEIFKFQHFAFCFFRLKAKKGRSIKYWYFIAKVGIDENVGVWVQQGALDRNVET